MYSDDHILFTNSSNKTTDNSFRFVVVTSLEVNGQPRMSSVYDDPPLDELVMPINIHQYAINMHTM